MRYHLTYSASSWTSTTNTLTLGLVPSGSFTAAAFQASNDNKNNTSDITYKDGCIDFSTGTCGTITYGPWGDIFGDYGGSHKTITLDWTPILGGNAPMNVAYYIWS